MNHSIKVISVCTQIIIKCVTGFISHIWNYGKLIVIRYNRVVNCTFPDYSPEIFTNLTTCKSNNFSNCTLLVNIYNTVSSNIINKPLKHSEYFRNLLQTKNLKRHWIGTVNVFMLGTFNHPV